MITEIIEKIFSEKIKEFIKENEELLMNEIIYYIEKNVMLNKDFQGSKELKEKLSNSHFLNSKELIQNEIQSEEFIDSIVERINRKQLK